MKFARIDLSKTNYSILDNAEILINPPIQLLQEIYLQYCRYKNFESVMPLFYGHFMDSLNDVIAYYDNNKIVAFSIMRILDRDNLEAWQFAWDYKIPKLRLGIRSLEHECAFYKNLGYKYLYVGEALEYKSKFDGYEILGKL